MILVPFTVAQTHLRVTDPVHDVEIQSKLEQASDAIVRFCDVLVDPPWDEMTAPLVVQAATLQLLTALWEKRGDDDDTAMAHTWANIRQLLAQIKTPALA
jgi:hypothetical protein